ncbi:MAG TPA: ABC transporter ATP-binding protein [bacterium]|nr:ABC transporter ATP-binding protein [bacterium]
MSRPGEALSASRPVLDLRGVTKLFGGIVACKDISFTLPEGQIMGLIGPNGAGKTTAFNLITGVYRVTAGSIHMEGEAITDQRPDRIVRRGVARTFQNIRLFRNLSVLDNVIIALDCHETYRLGASFLRLPGVRRRERALREEAMSFLGAVGLEDKAAVRADAMPYGLQRKLEIARALALKPRLLLLDEPAAGMNPEESLDLARLVRRIHDQFRLTTLLIEHHMDVVMALCERIFVMNFGVQLAEGTAEEVQRDPDVLKAYLGEGFKRAQHI